MADMLADLGGARAMAGCRERALRIWVQSGTDIRDWDLRYAASARDALPSGRRTTCRCFDFVIDSATSDVHVSWIDRFPPSRDASRI
jgi:hypothetical protein